MYSLIIYMYLALNTVSFLLYMIDKYKSVKGKYRIPEKTLLISAFIAPAGSILSMYIFRHKTRKNKFRITVPLFLIIHIIIFSYLLMNGCIKL